MAAIAIQKFATVGVNAAFTAASAGGDTLANNGQTYLFVKNSGGASITVTINSIAPCSYGFDHDQTATVNAGATSQLGPFPGARFNDTSGNVGITYSSVASVTVAAVSIV